MQLLLSVLGGGPDTPTSLSLDALTQLLCACHFALAEALLGGLAGYLAPGIAKLGVDDVRTYPPPPLPPPCGAVDVPRLLLGLTGNPALVSARPVHSFGQLGDSEREKQHRLSECM